MDIKDIIQGIDLIKMDVEGHESAILLELTPEQLKQVDILVEIGSLENAKSIFNHITKAGGHLFAQKKGWGKIDSLDEMPTSYRDGTLFISSKPKMPWGLC
ncbi:MAG: FkbM family methyltransferase [Simkania sp.]|nr:FkbM family methyltransferase [Simkania sp.]